ncbi:MAG: hypothetical protein LBB22_04930, partial [Treponema sp.]|nr:hypothetical protein [Treponema sp.]
MNEITMKIRSSGKKILLAMTLALVFAGCGEPAGSSGGNDEYGSTNGDDKKISVSGGEGSEFSVAFEPQGGVWSRDIPEDFWKNVVNA